MFPETVVETEKKGMTMRKVWIMGFAVAATLTAHAEPMRPFYTRENRQPELHQLEAGVAFDYREVTTFFGKDEFATTMATLRYGLAPELTLNVGLPHVTRTPDIGDSVDGFGDIRVGLTLRAWEDIFGFPYLIPYGEAAFPVEDEIKRLGESELWFVVGVAIGTTVHDNLHYALDASYKTLPDESNVASLKGALIYDLSKKTSILVEGEYGEKRDNELQDRQMVMAGLTYKPTRNWSVGFFGGGQVNANEGSDGTVVAVKVGYTFRPFIF